MKFSWKVFWESVLNIAHKYASRRGQIAIACALIGAGAAIISGGSWLFPLAVVLASKFGVTVPPELFQSVTVDIITKVIGFLLVLAGPVVWVWSDKYARGKRNLSLTFGEDRNYLLFSERTREGVFINDTKYEDGGKFWFQLDGRLSAIGADVELLEFDCRYTVNGPSLLNLELELKFKGEKEDEIVLSGFKHALSTPKFVAAHRSAHFFYLRHVATHKAAGQCPIDCEEGTIDLRVLYRFSDEPRVRLDVYKLRHAKNGDIQVLLHQPDIKSSGWTELPGGVFGLPNQLPSR